MKEPITKVKRNYGIDMLRLVAMFFVVICHVLGHGGVMKNATGYNYSVSSLLQIVAYCAVNCYAIISGYVGYKEEDNYHYTKYLKFWIPVFFYSVGITIIFYVINSGSVGIKEIIWAFFPVTTYEYWYVNAYTALFFLIPWINRLIQNITEKELNRLIFVLFMFFSVYLTFSTWFADTFTLGGGYDFAWLIILYIAGAWIKKNKINEKWRVSFWITMITICIAATWLWETFAPVAKRLFVSYISVTIVLMAVGMVAIFSRLQLSSRMIS
uniref:acyltransferase n=5 Tax=Bacillota TaxID=1239 RepID=UPI003079879B